MSEDSILTAVVLASMAALALSGAYVLGRAVYDWLGWLYAWARGRALGRDARGRAAPIHDADLVARRVARAAALACARPGDAWPQLPPMPPPVALGLGSRAAPTMGELLDSMDWRWPDFYDYVTPAECLARVHGAVGRRARRRPSR